MNLNPLAKRILCYGDSYTWGYIPATNHNRYDVTKRWTGILQKLLGTDYEIIEEGLNSRSLNSDDKRPGKEGRNGAMYLVSCLDTHDPIDLVILMLGTNELKDSFSTSEEEFAKVFEDNYVKVITTRKSQFRNTVPKLLIVSPPILDLSIEYAFERYSKSTDLNKKLASIYSDLAKKYDCFFLDAAQYIKAGADGVHFDDRNHLKLAEAIYSTMKEINL